MTRSVFRSLLALGLGCAAVVAQAQATPVGLWRTIDDETGKEQSMVRIVDSGGIVSGRIEKLLDPARAQADPVCAKCSGELKDKPIVGLPIIQGVRHSEGDAAVWDGGEILDPNNGKTYRLRLTLVDAGKKLAVRGYIGAPLLGRTQTWIRVE